MGGITFVVLDGPSDASFNWPGFVPAKDVLSDEFITIPLPLVKPKADRAQPWGEKRGRQWGRHFGRVCGPLSWC